MHASIRRFQASAELDADPALHGRRLASTMSDLPGFVSFAMLETEDGYVASIAIFEDRAGLAAGEMLLSAWLREHFLELNPGDPSSPILSGEIILQRGM